jgi:hypothetical protein
MYPECIFASTLPSYISRMYISVFILLLCLLPYPTGMVRMDQPNRTKELYKIILGMC